MGDVPWIKRKVQFYFQSTWVVYLCVSKKKVWLYFFGTQNWITVLFFFLVVLAALSISIENRQWNTLYCALHEMISMNIWGICNRKFTWEYILCNVQFFFEKEDIFVPFMNSRWVILLFNVSREKKILGIGGRNHMLTNKCVYWIR